MPKLLLVSLVLFSVRPYALEADIENLEARIASAETAISSKGQAVVCGEAQFIKNGDTMFASRTAQIVNKVVASLKEEVLVSPPAISSLESYFAVCVTVSKK